MVVYWPVRPWRGDILVPGHSVPLINPARLDGLQRAAFFLLSRLFKEMICLQVLTEGVVIPGQHRWRGTGDPFARRHRVLQEGQLPALQFGLLRCDGLFVSPVYTCRAETDLLCDSSEVSVAYLVLASLPLQRPVLAFYQIKTHSSDIHLL